MLLLSDKINMLFGIIGMGKRWERRIWRDWILEIGLGLEDDARGFFAILGNNYAGVWGRQFFDVMKMFCLYIKIWSIV